MIWYRATLDVHSPLRTPVKGDALWGHICWGIVHHDGEASLGEFLDAYEDEPQLIISDAFPAGYLPKPVGNIWGMSTTVSDLQREKQFKKQHYVQESVLLNNNAVTKQRCLHRKKPDIRSEVTSRTKNSIDRLQARVLEDGGLYAVDEIWLRSRHLDVYILSVFDLERTKNLLEQGIECGYGADSSIGYGHMSLSGMIEVSMDQHGAYAMALGGFVPSVDESPKLFSYELDTKFGKVSSELDTNNPFKKPYVRLTAGSCLKDLGNQSYVGSMLRGIHVKNDVVDLAYAPIIRFDIDKES